MTTQLNRLNQSMETAINKEGFSEVLLTKNWKEYIDDDKVEDIVKDVEGGILEAFDSHQRGLIIAQIKKVLNYHKACMLDEETMTIGIMMSGGTRRGKKRGGKETMETQREDVMILEEENAQLQQELDALKKIMDEQICSKVHFDFYFF